MAAMNPFRGCAHVTPRLLRHFHVLSFASYATESLHKIFSTQFGLYIEVSSQLNPSFFNGL